MLVVRKNIRDLKPYQPGKPIKELQRELGIKEADIIKLASNENPIGPSPKALKALRETIGGANRYPDGSCFYLKRRLAAKLSLKPENFILGNGSDELIDIITKAFLEEDQQAIITDPSFLEYKIIIKTRGAKARTVPLKGPEQPGKGARSGYIFRYDLQGIFRAISKKTKLARKEARR